MNIFQLILYNRYLKQSFLIILFIFLKRFNISCSIIQTGKYPYVKRLNNGNYIILSGNNITFVDDSFTQIINTLNFDSNIFSATEDIESSIVSQFKAKDNGYVIAVLFTTLYIFSSNGEYIKDISLSSYINGKYSCSVVPNSHSGNNYVLTFIYALSDSSIADSCNNLIFRKITFNPSIPTITISEDSSIFSPLIYISNKFRPFFSCEIMKKKEEEYIACSYGNNDKVLFSIFDINNYKENKTIISNYGSNSVKLIVLPDSKEDSIICSFKTGEGIKCNIFNIISESFEKQSEMYYQCESTQSSLILEYFYETNRIISGCIIDNSKYHLNKFRFSSSQLVLEESKTNDNLGQNIGKVGRINIILPSNKDKYYAFTYPIQCNNNCEPILNAIPDIELNIINTYPIISQSTTLICNGELYYNYEHTNCIETIPDGYYCNSTNDKTIDKCHNNCKTCNKGPSNYNHNCILCNDEYYYDFGNCLTYSECNNDVFTDNSIKKCKCRCNNKC